MYNGGMATRSRALRRFGYVAAGVLAVFAGAVGASWHFAGSLRMAAALVWIRAGFRHVQQISTKELAAWHADPGRTPPLLLDVREPAEYAVSHLAGARNVPWESDWQTQLKDIPATQPIVVYCSIGYRSSAFALKLQRAGFVRVANLEGSIFKWASEGRPMLGPGGAAATVVHPYDAAWGRLIAPRLRAPLPAEPSHR